MNANVQSNLWLAQMVAPDMVAKGAGSMMFTSSIGAFKAIRYARHLRHVQAGA